jgi:hypothetical protein
MDDTFISVPNWTKFQHYKDRSPSWIKVYTDLNSRDEWLGLTWGQRGLLVTAWLEYARAATHLRSETLRRLGSSAGSRYFQRDLEVLNHAGFLVVAASAETERLKDPEFSLDAIRGLAGRYGENRQ